MINLALEQIVVACLLAGGTVGIVVGVVLSGIADCTTEIVKALRKPRKP